MKIFLGTVTAAAGLLIIFLVVFYVPDGNAEVVGSIRYSDQEIRRMVFESFRDHNSLYLAWRRRVIEPDVYFINTIEVEYQGHNRVRLQVNEDMPIGYIEQDGYDYYFNSEGVVLEAMLMSENDPALQSWQPPGTSPNGQNSGNSGLTGTGGESTEAVADTSFHAALTDVTRIEGLTDRKLSVGSVIPAEDPSVFHTILALTKAFSKFDMKPDYIVCNEAGQLVLHYADVEANIGGNSDLEAKLARIQVILPQLEGMKGTLHLETWTPDTVNIVFSPASEEEEEAASAEDGEEAPDDTETDAGKAADAEEFYRVFLSQAPGSSEE